MTELTNDKRFDHASFLKVTPDLPGVYRMLDQDGHILYIGKAKRLKRRVASYFSSRPQSAKTAAMVARIKAIETIVTNSEGEALILEQNLIKENRPPYNILLRDDKSYPYIHLSDNHTWPGLSLYRGAKKRKGRYFGPYPSAIAARESLTRLQKMFRVRQCKDSFFRNRTRPCLQYQIGRCKGPCVELVGQDEYRQDVNDSVAFLQGRNQDLVYDLIARMESAAQQLNFEQAARYRDSVAYLRKIQEKQIMTVEAGNIDILGIARLASGSCVQVLFVRQGQVVGSRQFFPDTSFSANEAEALEAFLGQFYIRYADHRDFPEEIVLPCAIDGATALTQAIERLAQRAIHFKHQVRGPRRAWLQLAKTNAEQALTIHLSSRQSLGERFCSLQQELNLPCLPERIECFDISHTMGEEAVASCVVFDHNGSVNSDYRRFNIAGITPGDDYAAIAQAVERRYRNAHKGEGALPDLLLIDGGSGQLNRAKEVMNRLALDHIALFGVAKGKSRKPGLEELIEGSSGRHFTLAESSPGLHLIQQVRDESHRFALLGHRKRRDQKRRRSVLEDVEGIGPGRRAALLSFFGSLNAVKEASVAELSKVRGVSRQLAQTIRDALNG